ncbi:PAS domain S-box-containing protein/diguanylate cyclase (GGDEF) domain-containing protein [Allopseudospirillum japonicum]|uniref:PAS domain S-box-containing protein/diguanylate cyclase (GGDEF) domain-containing protein n=1 Tax=Allopseudospirillum japonicum TaxID=64971 RepID=A0A1H6R5T5_9GAMM|nr:diguanylate cyclase [Allopseudospirillum japonicum]SEI47150.1 PAS domain S-box-containing protein/diguanylate cyclase (GGDEF) domain-containing protein [Allopseudospirillum japonicum]
MTQKNATLYTHKRTLSLVLLLALGAILLLWQRWQVQIDAYINQSRFQLESQYYGFLQKHTHFMDVLASHMMAREDVLTMLNMANQDEAWRRQAARHELYLTLAEPYLQLGHLGIEQMQFVNRQGQSILRLHAPDHYGDPIQTIRPNFSLLAQRQQPLYGFEQGAFFSGFRGLYPLYQAKEYLGVLEFGYAASTLAKALNTLMPADYYLLAPMPKAQALQDYLEKENTLRHQHLDFLPDHYLQLLWNSHTQTPDAYALEHIKNLLSQQEEARTWLYSQPQQAAWYRIDQLNNWWVLYLLPVRDPQQNINTWILVVEHNGVLQELFINWLAQVGIICLLTLLLLAWLRQLQVGAKGMQTLMLHLDNAQKIAHFGSWEYSAAEERIYLSLEARRLLNLDTGQDYISLPHLLQVLTPSQQVQALQQDIQEMLGGKINEARQRLELYRPRLSVLVLDVAMFALRVAGQRQRIFGVMRDVTHEHQMRQQLREQEELFRTLSEKSPLGVILFREYPIYANAASCKLLGVESSQLMRTPIWQVFEEGDRELAYETLQRRLRGELLQEVREYTIPVTTEEQTRWILFKASTVQHEGQPLGMAVLDDISERLSREQHLKFLAEHDALTELPNRRILQARLRQLAGESSLNWCVLFMDLDHFKFVNDTYGHDIGDQVLIQFTRIVKSQMRKTDIFGRWGGEEFVLLAPASDIQEARKLAERIRIAVSKADLLPDQNKHQTVSIGLAQWQTGQDLDELLQQADAAVYQAKTDGRNCVRVYTNYCALPESLDR